MESTKLAVVIPCYKCKDQILGVLERIPKSVDRIYVVDDKCPQETGKHALENYKNDERLSVLFNEKNQGVGGAVIAGYKKAIEENMAIAVKIDGDGQMDPQLIPEICQPILLDIAEYCKGNRFISPRTVQSMPIVRKLGNLGLSFMAKASTGYWKVFDPNNGYTAINVNILRYLELDRIDKRYFFESDMLFRLNLVQAKVADIPMESFYGDEVSNLSEMNSIPKFFSKHIANTFKRIIYKYFFYSFGLPSLQLIASLILLPTALIYGGYNFMKYTGLGVAAPLGVVMIASLLTLVGFQLLLHFLNYDIGNSKSFIHFGSVKNHGDDA